MNKTVPACSSYLLKGPTIVGEHELFHEHVLQVVNDTIVGIVPADQLKSSSLPVIEFPSDHYLIPGMIDMHIHGASGADVMDGSLESLATISRTLFKTGTTRYLATTMTETTDHIDHALQTVYAFTQQPAAPDMARIAGVHLEGPFLSVKQMGAQQGSLIQNPSIALLDHWQTLAGGLIRQVTVAPEQPEALALIRHCQRQNVITSIGHTDATYAQAKAAIDAGATHATHLFNAMRGIHHREPGTVTAILLDERVVAELILDGFHLHPAIVQLTLKVKGKDCVVLVTDAMRAQCMGNGVFDLGGQAVTVRDGQARLANGVLAGSVLELNRALANILQFGGCSLVDAVAMVSMNPARQLGIAQQVGSLAVGKRADWVVLDAHYQVVKTGVTDLL